MTACCLQFSTGQGRYTLSPPCWLCRGDWCNLAGDFAVFQTPVTAPNIPLIPLNISATVSVPGGGSYTLAYKLQLGGSPTPPNLFQATIASVDGSFPLIVLESIVDISVGFDPTNRELGFNLPDGTSVIRLTFKGAQVWKHYNPCAILVYPRTNLLCLHWCSRLIWIVNGSGGVLHDEPDKLLVSAG